VLKRIAATWNLSERDTWPLLVDLGGPTIRNLHEARVEIVRLRAEVAKLRADNRRRAKLGRPKGRKSDDWYVKIALFAEDLKPMESPPWSARTTLRSYVSWALSIASRHNHDKQQKARQCQRDESTSAVSARVEDARRC
jgi:hypothetical protein